jgi:hypothetical protein
METAFVTHQIDWVGPGACLNASGDEKNLAPTCSETMIPQMSSLCSSYYINMPCT